MNLETYRRQAIRGMWACSRRIAWRTKKLVCKIVRGGVPATLNSVKDVLPSSSRKQFKILEQTQETEKDGTETAKYPD